MTIQPENSPYEGFQAEIADNTFSPIKTGFPDLRREDHRVAMFRPFSVILVQFRLAPVFVRDYGLLTVIAMCTGIPETRVIDYFVNINSI